MARDESRVLDEDEAPEAARDAGGEPHADGGLRRSPRRERLGGPGGVRAARRGEGTRGASRGAREADERPELHEGLVVVARVAPVQEARRRGFDGGARRPAARVARNRVEAAEDPRHVPVDEGDGDIPGDGGDGRGGVGADAGQGAQPGHGPRDRAPLLGDGAGGAVEVACAGVVPEAAPLGEDLPFPGRGEGVDGGEAGEEPLPAGRARGDRGLLEKDLGDPDGPRVLRPAEREVAALPAIPAQERGAKGGGRRG